MSENRETLADVSHTLTHDSRVNGVWERGGEVTDENESDEPSPNK